MKCITGVENIKEPGEDYSGRPTSWINEIEKARKFVPLEKSYRKPTGIGIKYSFKVNVKVGNKHISNKDF